jgi:hypothetical protein
MKQSELDYKQETGLAPRMTYVKCFDCGALTTHNELPNDEYIEWLEEKYDELRKYQNEHHISWKLEFDNAVNEIGQLQDQLNDAIDEIKRNR